MEKKRIKKEVYLADDEEILIIKKRKPSFLKKMWEEKKKQKNIWWIFFFLCVSLIRWFIGIICFIISLIVLAPFLLQLHGDVILTKMFFQTWCKIIENIFIYIYIIFCFN